MLCCSIIYLPGYYLAHFLLEPECEDYSFLDQAAAGFEHGLDSVSSQTLLTCPNMMHPLMTLMPFPLQSLEAFYAQLVPILIIVDSNLVNYDAKLGLCFLFICTTGR